MYCLGTKSVIGRESAVGSARSSRELAITLRGSGYSENVLPWYKKVNLLDFSRQILDMHPHPDENEQTLLTDVNTEPPPVTFGRPDFTEIFPRKEAEESRIFWREISLVNQHFWRSLMKWIRLRKSVGLVLACLGISLATAAKADDEVSLKVESKVQMPGKQPGTIEVTYTLVNTSSKPITAYKFGCTVASQNGSGNFSYLGEDGYLSWERFLAGEDVEFNSGPYKGYLLPGERVLQTMSFNLLDRDGPFAGTTCGVAVAVFADTSVEGEPFLAETFFMNRAAIAIDSSRVIRSLEEQLSQGAGLEAAISRIREQLSRSSIQEGGVNLAVELLIEFHEAKRKSGEAFAGSEILDLLRKDQERAMRHLPSNWAASVMEKIQ
jgi:hypothetical protein